MISGADMPFWVRFADNRYGLELSAMQYRLTLLLEGGRLCHASGGRAAHRQAFPWSGGIKYLLDFFTVDRRQNCKRYVCAGLPQSLAMSSGIRPQQWGLMPLEGRVIIPG
jgi:hypothetical protein